MALNNLPGFETELIDGGLAFPPSEVISDSVLLVGFTSPEAAYINFPQFEPVKLNKGEDVEFIAGTAASGCNLTRAVYEAVGAGANSIYVLSLGAWGSGVFIDPNSSLEFDMFDGDVTPNYPNIYRALEYAYDILEDYEVDVVVPVDLYAWETIDAASAGLNRLPNFAYQLARFCYDVSSDNNETIGVIGVRPATSITLAGIGSYVGTVPTLNGDGIITGDGTGLLGEPFMSGNTTREAGFFLSSHSSGWAPITTGGALIAGEIVTDRRGNRIDIGKYISIVAAEPVMNSGAYASGYTANCASAYAGLVSSLDPKSAPTNKPVPGVTALRYRTSTSQLNNLTGARYVTLRDRAAKGIVVTDAPTAARPSSDYNRLSTVRIVNATLNLVRKVVDPFIGEPNNNPQRNAMDTAVKKQLSNMVKAGALQSFDYKIRASAQDQVLGRMTIEMALVVAFEVRQIKAVLTLKAPTENSANTSAA